MRKVPQEAIDKLGAALVAAYPDRYPMPEQHILLRRILWARYFGPQARFRAGREDQWFAGEWTHSIGRDRRGQKEMMRLVAAGIHEYQGKRIYAKTSEPYIERWSRMEVYEVWLDIDLLPNLEEVIGVDTM